MSNILGINITGKMPFNTYEYAGLTNFLGQLNAPSFGFKIAYGKTSYGPINEHGGQTCYYEFAITGEEAVSSKWVEALLQAIVNATGTIDKVSVRDTENNIRLRFEKPERQERTYVAEVKIYVDMCVSEPEPLVSEHLLGSILNGKRRQTVVDYDGPGCLVQVHNNYHRVDIEIDYTKIRKA